MALTNATTEEWSFVAEMLRARTARVQSEAERSKRLAELSTKVDVLQGRPGTSDAPHAVEVTDEIEVLTASAPRWFHQWWSSSLSGAS